MVSLAVHELSSVGLSNVIDTILEMSDKIWANGQVPDYTELVMRYYSEICKLPSARSCDSSLIIQPHTVSDSVDYEGDFDGRTNTIRIVMESNPYNMITTLLHEVAHYASNPRHSRPHGYSWANTFSQLTYELIGVDPKAEAKAIRDYWYIEYCRYFKRSSALDAAVTKLVTQKIKL